MAAIFPRSKYVKNPIFMLPIVKFYLEDSMQPFLTYVIW